MKTIQNHQGMSIINVLAIISFLVLGLSTAVTLVIFQFRTSSRVAAYESQYLESYQLILSTYRALDSSLTQGSIDLSNPFWISYQETYNLEITQSGDTYFVSRSFLDNVLVGRYVLGETSTTTTTLFDDLASTRELISEPLLRTHSLLDSYIDLYYFGENLSDTRTFAQSMTYLKNNAEVVVNASQFNQTYVSQNTYVIGSKTLGTNELIVAPGKYLVFEGSLTINNNQFSRLDGTIITSGFINISRASNNAIISGVYFTNGYFRTDRNFTLGQVSTPIFVFAKDDINILINPRFYGYMVSEQQITMQSSQTLYGGVYSFASVPTSSIPIPITLDDSFLTSTQGQFLNASLSTSGGQRVVYKPILNLPK
jgi:hypothetical protein